MGRPKRTDIDKLRTMAWYELIREQLGLRSAYEMDNYFGSDTNRNWYKYKEGTRVPTHATLEFVEGVCPESRSIFDIGPKRVKLWAALNADHSELWHVIDDYYPEHKNCREVGILGIVQYMNFVNKDLIFHLYSPLIEYIDHSKGVKSNVVSKALSENLITISPNQFACFIALWRLCLLVGYNLVHGEYLLAGIRSALNGNLFGKEIDPLLDNYIKDNLS